MSTILNDDLIKGCPEEEFAIMVFAFSQNKTEDNYNELYQFATKHFKKNSGKLCWKKYHYFAITNPKQYERAKRLTWKRLELNAIIASEAYQPRPTGYPKCKVYRTSKHGPKERRCQWFELHRSQDNPILSSGWKFTDYDIFEISEEMFEFLWNFLPHQPENI